MAGNGVGSEVVTLDEATSHPADIFGERENVTEISEGRYQEYQTNLNSGGPYEFSVR